MRKILLFITVSLLTNQAFSQLRIQPGTEWVSTGAIKIILQDISLVNDGVMTAGNSRVSFAGSANSTAGGIGAISFHELEIAR